MTSRDVMTSRDTMTSRDVMTSRDDVTRWRHVMTYLLDLQVGHVHLLQFPFPLLALLLVRDGVVVV